MFKQLFSRTPMDAFDWMNRKSLRTKYLQQSDTDTMTKHKKEHKYSTLKKNPDGKNNFFAMPLPMTMLMLRCRCQDFQMASIKTPFGCCFLIIELNEKFLHAEALKNFINRSNSLDYRSQITVRTEKEEMEKQGERASIFYYQAKVHLYSGQTPQQKQM